MLQEPREHSPQSFGEAINQGAAACDDKSSLKRFRLLCRAGSSPQVVLLTDIAMDVDQKPSEHSNSQRRSPSEAPESQLHEPGTPGKQQKSAVCVITCARPAHGSEVPPADRKAGCPQEAPCPKTKLAGSSPRLNAQAWVRCLP